MFPTSEGSRDRSVV